MDREVAPAGTGMQAGGPGVNAEERCSQACLDSSKCPRWPDQDCHVVVEAERRLATNASDHGKIDWALYCRAMYVRAVHDIDLIYGEIGKRILGPIHRLHGLVAGLNNVLPARIQQLEKEARALEKRIAELNGELEGRGKKGRTEGLH